MLHKKFLLLEAESVGRLENSTRTVGYSFLELYQGEGPRQVEEPKKWFFRGIRKKTLWKHSTRALLGFQ